ncbi:MAG: hypothetical protein AAF787_21875 [Chloroflexota bacterium]
MSSSWHDNFVEDIHHEVAQLFDRLCQKKQVVWRMVEGYLEQEREFLLFLEQYDRYFREHNDRLAKLRKEETDLRQKLEQQESGVFDFATDSDLPPDDDTENRLDDFTETDDDEWYLPDDILDATVVAEQDNADFAHSLKRQRESLKRRIGRTFVRIYHPRLDEDTNNRFLAERSSLVTSLMRDPRYDAVEIMLRLPFDERDRSLWEKPLVISEETGEREESIGERWHRYRLWERMLEVAQPKAEAMAGPLQHDLYPAFVAVQQSNQRNYLHFHELEKEKTAELERLQVTINRLRQRVSQSGASQND